ncbi:MAG: hypothetical protein IJN90_01225 [Bacilli bacterium]|nr:hypothetical protein [Bacilli bacterium]
MGFLNKVKNIFFEEEIIEIEDEPKKAKKEEPVAKKIELPKVEKVKKEEIEEIYEEETEIDLSEEKEIKEEKEVKFPMDFDEDDFREERREYREEYQEPIVSRRSDRRQTPIYDYDEPRVEEVFEEEIKEETKYDFESEYGKEKEPETHGLYEGKTPKKAFTPTPIISPIYGILDKNYKKDDVVTKKEIRLSSAPKKIDLDSVREKAYGDLTSDISQSMEEVEPKKYEEEIVDLVEEDDLLYDLNEASEPAPVKKVTVGDAEEYFNELGLEYNIDYKDTSVENSRTAKEKTRRTEEKEEKEPVEIESDEVEETEEDDGLESNLFDLIESMYDEKE